MTLTRRFLLGAAAALALTPAAQAEPEVTLKLHQFLPANSFVPARILDPWADAIEEQSGGRIAIARYPSMQLGGKPSDLVDQVVDGVVDIIWTLPGYTPGRFPQTEVMELPFMVRDSGAASRAYWRLAEAQMMDSDFRDLHLLGIWVHGPGVIHASRPVEKIEDMAGLKLRGPSRVTTQLLERLGATAVGMPAPAVPESLSKGVIDGALFPWEVTSSVRVGELVHNHTEFPDTGIYVASLMLAMNKDAYARLPDDLRAIIDANSGEAFSAHAGAIQQGADAPMRDEALAAGNRVITLDAPETARWVEAAQPVIADWVAASADQGFDGAALIAAARAGIAAAEAESAAETAAPAPAN